MLRGSAFESFAFEGNASLAKRKLKHHGQAVKMVIDALGKCAWYQPVVLVTREPVELGWKRSLPFKFWETDHEMTHHL